MVEPEPRRAPVPAFVADPDPDPGADARPDVYGFEPFAPADLSPLVPTATLDDPARARPAVERFVREALESEGPMELDRLVRSVAARCALSRVVQRRREAIVALIPASLPRTEGGAFVWPAYSDPGQWTRARRADPAVRSAGEISLVELVHGMTVMLEGAFSMSEDELVAESARAFGFGRVTPLVRERFVQAIAGALAAGRFIRAEERLELAERAG